jgi:hypothetical protein
LLEKLIEHLFSLDVLVEFMGVISEVFKLLNLHQQDLIKFLDILADFRARFVNLSKKLHLLLYNINTLFAVGVVLEYQLLFILQDLLNQFLVLFA